METEAEETGGEGGGGGGEEAGARRRRTPAEERALDVSGSEFRVLENLSRSTYIGGDDHRAELNSPREIFPSGG